MLPQVIESCSCTEIYLNEYAKNRHFVEPHKTMSPTKCNCSKKIKTLTNVNKRIKLIEEIIEALSDLKDNFIAERNQLKKSQQNYNNKNKKEGIRNCKNTYHDIIKIYPKRKSKSEYEEIFKKIDLKTDKIQKNQRQKTKTGGKCEHPVNEVFPTKHKIEICNCTNLKNNEKHSKIKSESIESIQYFLESILGKSESENTINLNDNNCNNSFNPTNQKSVSAENKELHNKCVCHRKQYIDEMPSYSKPKPSSENSDFSELMWKEWSNQSLDRTSTDKSFERDSSEIKIVNIKEILDLISSGKDCPTEIK